MELYHVMNRGIDERDLFLDSRDYVRFIHNLYSFNDVPPAAEFVRRISNDPHANVGPRRSHIRERLVDIHGWVLMKNHYHLLLTEIVEGGLIQFMTRVNVGYAKYYNERYSRHGHVFQGKTKKVQVKDQSHFLYILHYVHLNPLDYLAGAYDWRVRDKGSIKNRKQALEYLRSYRWSSYLDYCGQKNFPSILTKDLFVQEPNEYQGSLQTYLRDIEIPMISNIILE